MEAVKSQLRSGLTWAPQNDPIWSQKETLEKDPEEGFKPKIAARKIASAPPAPVPSRDAFREILDKFQD